MKAKKDLSHLNGLGKTDMTLDLKRQIRLWTWKDRYDSGLKKDRYDSGLKKTDMTMDLKRQI